MALPPEAKARRRSILQMSLNDTEESNRKHKGLKRKMEDMERQLKAQKIIEDPVILEGSSESSGSTSYALGKRP